MTSWPCLGTLYFSSAHEGVALGSILKEASDLNLYPQADGFNPADACLRKSHTGTLSTFCDGLVETSISG